MDTHALAYLKGVLDGDGYIDRSRHNPRLCLTATNKGFVQRFASMLKFLGLVPRLTEKRERHNHKKHIRFQKYDFECALLCCRATCSPEVIDLLKNFEPLTDLEKRYYLKGFYDSEGSSCSSQNFTIWKTTGHKVKNGHKHEVRFTNKDVRKLQRIHEILNHFGINSKIYNSTHYVSYLAFYKKEHYLKFFELIWGDSKHE